MRTAWSATLCAAIAIGLCLSAAPAPAAVPAPAWQLTATPIPAAFAPGGEGQALFVAANVGAAASSGPIVVEATLPGALEPEEALMARFGGKGFTGACTIAAPTVHCETASSIEPGGLFYVKVDAAVAASPPPGPQTIEAGISGGGALPVGAATSPPLQSEPVPFGFLASGLRMPLTDADGAPTALAASHPYQQTVDFGFPARPAGNQLTTSGHPHDIELDLPPGMLGDPTATPLLCNEAQLLAEACPPGSQVGIFNLTTTFGQAGLVLVGQGQPVYDMVPPPGAPGELATNVIIGAFAHMTASLRSDGDYGITIASHDVLALGADPLFGLKFQIWGDPSSPLHNGQRGLCLKAGGSCPAPPASRAFLTTPGSCPNTPYTAAAHADSWEEPGSFVSTSYQSADLAGDPISLSGCDALSFEPSISSQPTTNLADSPTGLDFTLHQPQEAPHEDPLTGRGAAELKDATATLPAGMVANPSQADGLAACSAAQIGLLTPVGQGSPVHLSKEPQSCPDGAKLGTMEVASPLLGEYGEEGTKLAVDPETGAPIPRPLEGSVYLAQPFENPFGSLLAIYLAVEDQKSGIVAKLAGKVIPDPDTGQLTARFEENPQLPLEDVKLHFFGGARASLITPPTCGTHTTSSDLTSWSAPEGKDAHPQSSFQITQQPGGGSCPSSAGSMPNKPAFSAGTLAPQAGAYSPFVLKVSRGDGSQRIAGIDTLLPPGLTGKLAGIAQCSEAQLAQAKSRGKPNQGILEKNGPSCSSASEVGSVDVAAGAGPTPFHTSGHAYLSGPYKGAPLSLAVIVPAVAGPFDLGAVVSRVALYVEPESAQIHAVSDPLPQIIEGIPLDVRSIVIEMGRPQFTLNPTSCDPMSITGSALSALGNSAALSNPFQVGGCPQLPFKPKLNLKLKGGTKRASHPKLIANLKAKPGEANIAEAQVKLPPSAFLDQAHIRTVCTRVQFAADRCPKGSTYGKAEARTPLLDYPLSGNVYLRSSNHKLPDLVVALKGPEHQPIEIDLVGKTDSVKGALRNTFEAVPDAPVSSFRLELFGGKRGLVVNSRDLCAHRYRAEVNLTGQNGKVFGTTPVVGTGCGKFTANRNSMS